LRADEVFRRLIDSVREYAILVVDPDGQIASWNFGAERLYGYKSEEVIGKPFNILYTEADLKAHKPAHELEIAARTGHFENEGWRVRKGGSRFSANVITTRLTDDAGNLIGFGEVTRDLTEHRQSELRYRLLVEGVMDYAIFSMDPTGHITSWNVGAERIKGYAADEIIGRHFSAFYTPEDRAKGLPEHVLETAKSRGHFEGEGWRVRKDGSRFWASVVVTALRDDEGGLYGFSKVTRDMTDRKRLLDELQRHAEELELRIAEREESNAELEAFAYSVSHDLRAPLRAVTGFTEALAEDYAGSFDKRGREYLNDITSAAARMSLLVQDLLEYGRVSRVSIPLETVSVLKAVEDAAKEVSKEARERLTLTIAPDLVVVAHGRVLTQIISNLLSNAFKFQAKDVVPDVRVFAASLDSVVRISIADNGIGIAPEHQERIWNIFERLHDRDAYAGTGIGLAIVKRAVTRLRGTYGVDSEVGKGSTFWLELPRAQQAETRNYA
jgi:PAS domain S-box-containing protein